MARSAGQHKTHRAEIGDRLLVALALVVIPLVSMYAALSFDSAEDGVYSSTRSTIRTVMVWALAPALTLVVTRFSRAGVLVKVAVVLGSSLMTWTWTLVLVAISGD